MVPLHQLRRCGPLKTFKNVRNESGFGPRFPGHLGNRTRCLTLGISQALHCHDTPSAPRIWWVLCRDDWWVWMDPWWYAWNLQEGRRIAFVDMADMGGFHVGILGISGVSRPSKVFCVILCWTTCTYSSILNIPIWQCVKTLYPWWTSK